ncbi:MAG: hypothetical protein EPO30_02955 [Lysobacteraceae bacterium]|nr:MAG: hypothetical protein EPO30_02955 [Xanthomonadaceae bacterium]
MNRSPRARSEGCCGRRASPPGLAASGTCCRRRSRRCRHWHRPRTRRCCRRPAKVRRRRSGCVRACGPFHGATRAV